MSLALPLALAWAAVALPIVIFYILKVRLRQVPVSTTIFWRQIYDEKRPRSIWQVLRHLVSLLVQLLLLMLLVLALTDPFFNWEILQARRLILVVDNSASMNAADVAPTRLDAARRLGHAAITGLRFRDEMAIISAGTQPKVICGLTGHERTLQAALNGVQPTDGPTQVTQAVELGKRLLGDAKHGRLIVLSDGCFAGSEALLDDQVVEIQVVGTRAGNIGITNFQVRRSLIDPVGYEILMEVTNASDKPLECRLEVDLNDAPVDVLPLTLTPGQRWTKTIEKTSVAGGSVVGTLRVPSSEKGLTTQSNGTPTRGAGAPVPTTLGESDALAVDNVAIALLPKRTEQRVVLVTQGNLFLRKAVEVNALVNLQVVSALPATFDPAALYVLHRLAPEKMPAANCLVIDPAASSDLWQVGEKLENPIVTKQDADSPLMRHVRLDNVLLPEALKLTPPEGHQPLVTALSGDPLYFAVEKDGRKVLVLTVNLDQGDLTFRTAFPILVTNALGWFAGQSGELRESLASGAVTEVTLPADRGAAILACQKPDGTKLPLPLGLTKTSIGPLDQCGIWRIMPNVQPASGRREPPDGVDRSVSPHHQEADASRSPVIELACNLANGAESDLRVPEKLLASRPAAGLATSWFSRPVWLYLVATAWLLATAEWFLYQRRWIS